MRLRSPLFAPGDSERKMTKAIASAADAVILDLEDSVAAPAKPTARAMVPDVVRGHPGRGLIVRVNPPGTPWYLDDLAAVVPARPAGVMLPKCSGPEDLARLVTTSRRWRPPPAPRLAAIGVVAIVTETAGSVFNLGAYGGVASRLLAICFGAEDLSADLGISPRHPDGSYPAPVVLARAQILVAAGALGVPAIDTPYPDHGDPAGLRREAAAAAADGFAGKILIHPAQIDIVNAAFTPSPERVALGRAGERGVQRQPGCRRVRARRQDDRPAALETGAAHPGRCRTPVGSGNQARASGRASYCVVDTDRYAYYSALQPEMADEVSCNGCCHRLRGRALHASIDPHRCRTARTRWFVRRLSGARRGWRGCRRDGCRTALAGYRSGRRGRGDARCGGGRSCGSGMGLGRIHDHARRGRSADRCWIGLRRGKVIRALGAPRR